MKEYKGKGGTYIVVDGENLTIKVSLTKTGCKYSDIVDVQLDHPSDYQGSVLTIFTKKPKSPHKISFDDSQKSAFVELYNTIRLKCADAIAESEQYAAQIAERVRRMDKYGIAYCPECKSPSLAPKFSETGIDMVYCMKCGHDFHPGK
jgi:Zn ribbon nucleic-acid-binding protein